MTDQDSDYLSVGILDRAVLVAEVMPTSRRKLSQMVVGILNFYFPAAEGYLVASEGSERHSVNLLEETSSGRKQVETLVGIWARKGFHDVNETMERVIQSLEVKGRDNDGQWFVFVHGSQFAFFHYHHELPIKSRLVPLTHDQCVAGNGYDAREHVIRIDWAFRVIKANPNPSQDFVLE